MDSYYFVIAVTLIGFIALAAALLVPVYLFLKKEERAAEEWTEESLRALNESEQNSGANVGAQSHDTTPSSTVVN